MRIRSYLGVGFLLGAVCALGSAAQAGWSPLFDFTPATGEYPVKAPPVQDASGAIYGMTSGSQLAGDHGTVYRATPPRAGHEAWTVQVLHRFSKAQNAGFNLAGVSFGADGALYGMTALEIFRLAAPAAGEGGWVYERLHAFGGAGDVSVPSSNLLLGTDGAFYATAEMGGASALGGVLRLSHDSAGWTETVIHSFTSGEGGFPRGSLAWDASAGLVGAANAFGPGGGGTIYRLASPPDGPADWQISLLHSFGKGDGRRPLGVMFDAAGHLYGATEFRGNRPAGIVYELSPPGTAGGAWRETFLDFSAIYLAGPAPAPDGSLIAPVVSGLAPSRQVGLVRLSPPAGAGHWTRKWVHRYVDEQFNDLLAGKAGAIYGTTIYGKAAPAGTLYEVTP